MKKIGILILTLIVICSCEKIKPNNNEEKEKEESRKAKLVEYGRLVYENDVWIKGGIKEGTYFMTLTEMSERNKYDISMFQGCDREKTKIEFIVSEESEEGKTNYKFNPVLSCN